MTTQEIATQLYELCKKADYATAHSELYSTNATSTESDMQGGIVTVEGLDAIREKEKKFQSMIEEMHGGYCNEPKVFGNNIFMEMGMDVTMKGMGRMNMNEMCFYTVADGKIASEQFYY